MEGIPYDVGKELGGGTYGSVYLAVDKKLGGYVALKKFAPIRAGFPILREIDVLNKMKSPYVLHSPAEPFSSGDSTYLVLPVMEGDLYKLIRSEKFPFDAKRRMFAQICFGIADMNTAGMIHGDIKEENVLYTRDPVTKEIRLNVADFNLTCYVSPDGDMKEGDYAIYSPTYRPPECFRKNGITRIYVTSDTWALGLLFLSLFEKQPYELNPKYNDYVGLKQAQLMEGDTRFLTTFVKKHAPNHPHLLDFLRRVFTVDPTRRPTTSDIIRHPFLRDIPRSPAGEIDPPRHRLSYYVKPLDNTMRGILHTKVEETDWLVESIFLWCDLVHRGDIPLKYTNFDEYVELCKTLTKLILTQSLGNLGEMFPLMVSLKYILYRPYLYAKARNPEDLRRMVPLLYSPKYLRIDLDQLIMTYGPAEKASKQLPYRSLRK